MKHSVLVFVFALLACGPSARQRAISSTLASANVASKAFVFFDLQHQQTIVSQAKTQDDANSQLATWRQQRRTAELLFDALYRAIAAAATLDDSVTFQSMTSAATLLWQELSQLGVKIP